MSLSAYLRLRSLSETGDVCCLQKPLHSSDGYTFEHWQGRHVICGDPLGFKTRSHLSWAWGVYHSGNWWQPAPARFCPNWIFLLLCLKQALGSASWPIAGPCPHLTKSSVPLLTCLHYTLFHLLPHGLGLLPPPPSRKPPGNPFQPRTAVSHPDDQPLLWHFISLCCVDTFVPG